jgi:ABC-2 type transport system ATP-binding protein
MEVKIGDVEVEVSVQTFNLTRVFETKKKGSGFLGSIKRKKENIVAADHLNISINKGELFGLVGPNGAGKTTTIKMLCTLLSPTSGTASVGGHDISEERGKVREKINVVLGGERAFYWRLTGRENLWAFSQFYNITRKTANTRIKEVLDLVELADRADDRVERYSKGMKQRLHIARALLNDPEILFLDEPTLGLDPDGARKVRHYIKTLVEEKQVTVLLTTHYMYEAEEMCDRVAIINKGRIVALDTPRELKKLVRKTTVLELILKGTSDQSIQVLKEISGVENVVIKGISESDLSQLRLQTDGKSKVVAEVTESLVKNGVKILSFRTIEPTLEDVFIKLVGAGLE